MFITVDPVECHRPCRTSYVMQWDYTISPAPNSNDVEDFGPTVTLELVPDSFLSAMEDLNSGEIVSLDVALDKPSPNE